MLFLIPKAKLFFKISKKQKTDYQQYKKSTFKITKKIIELQNNLLLLSIEKKPF